MVNDDGEVMTAQYKVACLVESIRYGKCLLPTRVIRHPSLQQNRFVEGHWLCFLKSQYPMLCLDQSVAWQVGFVMS